MAVELRSKVNVVNMNATVKIKGRHDGEEHLKWVICDGIINIRSAFLLGTFSDIFLCMPCGKYGNEELNMDLSTAW